MSGIQKISERAFGTQESVGSSSEGSVRTVFVFLDLPRHVEFRAGDLPLMEEGLEMEFDLSITSPKDPRKTRKIEGKYKVVRRALKFNGNRPGLKGMTQYLEWDSST